MRRRRAAVAVGLIAAHAALNVYAIESAAAGALWVAAIIGGALLAAAGVLNYYRGEWAAVTASESTRNPAF